MAAAASGSCGSCGFDPAAVEVLPCDVDGNVFPSEEPAFVAGVPSLRPESRRSTAPRGASASRSQAFRGTDPAQLDTHRVPPSRVHDADARRLLGLIAARDAKRRKAVADIGRGAVESFAAEPAAQTA
jgi:hypothetical protein